MSKRILIAVIISGLVGGFFGSIAVSNYAKADFLGNIWNFIIGSTSTTSNSLGQIKKPTLYSSTDSYEQAIINAVQGASPSVVSVVISKDLPVIEQCPYNPF